MLALYAREHRFEAREIRNEASMVQNEGDYFVLKHSAFSLHRLVPWIDLTACATRGTFREALECAWHRHRFGK
jgi:hypothetical protein